MKKILFNFERYWRHLNAYGVIKSDMNQLFAILWMLTAPPSWGQSDGINKV